MALNVIKQLYNKIFPWSDSIYYGAGAYAKFIIILVVFQQCFLIIYSYKVKKGGDNK